MSQTVDYLENNMGMPPKWLLLLPLPWQITTGGYANYAASNGETYNENNGLHEDFSGIFLVIQTST